MQSCTSETPHSAPQQLSSIVKRMLFESWCISASNKRMNEEHYDTNENVVLKRADINSSNMKDKKKSLTTEQFQIKEKKSQRPKGRSNNEFTEKKKVSGQLIYQENGHLNDGGKADPKSDDETSSFGSKSRNQSQKLSGKSIDDSLKASGKSKDVDTAKSSGHSKQDTKDPQV
ncbi:hypothetical protein Fot_41904 [Forsythia ovata]|uniref:Uncharacterized protein n=1 Tax=Forsythia ovata TaxID=205694 RepID=A0ABD1RJQ6_9LAMI